MAYRFRGCAGHAQRGRWPLGDPSTEPVDPERARRAAGEGASFLDQAGDMAARGIDSVGDHADTMTGGRFSEQIDSVENSAEGFVDQDGSAGTREV